ncbi:hypothetical protein CY35_18G057700 [Sphagnum magellanicum]|nr:hypothetical protein CY35_18G057700 [Sphagnum magellanicum]
MISGSHQEGPIKPHSYLSSLDCIHGAQVCDQQQTWVYCSHYFFAALALALVVISSCLGQVLSTTHFFDFSRTSNTAATLFRIPFKVFGLFSAKEKAEMSSKIQLYTLGTPNGMKIGIALEEMELEYDVHIIDISKNDQFTPEFIAINPNSKIPAIVDPDGPDGKPLTVFESGAILLYLAQKTGKFLSHDPRLKWETIQWLFFQMAGVGPMFGQLGAVKIYLAAAEALRKKERQDETQFTTKIDGFLSFTPPWNANVLFRSSVISSSMPRRNARIHIRWSAMPTR